MSQSVPPVFWISSQTFFSETKDVSCIFHALIWFFQSSISSQQPSQIQRIITLIKNKLIMGTKYQIHPPIGFYLWPLQAQFSWNHAAFKSTFSSPTSPSTFHHILLSWLPCLTKVTNDLYITNTIEAFCLKIIRALYPHIIPLIQSFWDIKLFWIPYCSTVLLLSS